MPWLPLLPRFQGSQPTVSEVEIDCLTLAHLHRRVMYMAQDRRLWVIQRMHGTHQQGPAVSHAKQEVYCQLSHCAQMSVQARCAKMIAQTENTQITIAHGSLPSGAHCKMHMYIHVSMCSSEVACTASCQHPATHSCIRRLAVVWGPT